MSGSAQYLLDTNVLSETRRQQPDDRVLAFLRSAGRSNLFVSVMVLGELRKGVAIKARTDPAVARSIAAWVDALESQFAKRILAIDAATSRLWGEWSAQRPRAIVDTLLAATAEVHGLTLATRNMRDVSDLPIVCVDPWLHSR